MTAKQSFVLTALCICIAAVLGCRSSPIPIPSPRIVLTSQTETWPVSSPEAQGVDSIPLTKMLMQITEQDARIDSVSIVRNGHLILDAYHYPFKAGEKHIIHSCTKSIVSALIGIAISDGIIPGIETSLPALFPNRSIANLGIEKQQLTLEHLLTMTSGLDCQDSYLYRWKGLNQMRQQIDWVQHVLDLPMAHPPGTYFEYCNGASFTLSALIHEKSGMTTLEFAQEHLFKPLGITDVSWPANPQGINIGWGELQMLPLDMVKIGQLYLDNGRWGDAQIVPANWVADSTKKHIAATLEDGYGYQWWVDDSGYYMALGYAGQFIFVVPDQNLVAVFTSDLPEQAFYLPQQLLTDYIMPAARESDPLPENTSAYQELQIQIQVLANP